MGGVHPRNTRLAHRERGVAETGVDPRTTGRAHRKTGICKEVRHGLEDLESDGHRLRGSRCSSWAPRTLALGYLKFHQKLVISSARGIELRLLLEVIANPLGINQPIVLFEILVFSLFGLCPGDGGMAEIITLGGLVAVQLIGVLLVDPSPARIGKWIGEVGLGLKNSS